MNLKTDRGIIENLQIVRTQQNILYSPHMKEAAGVSAIVFAVAGMGAAAVQTSANSEGGVDEVDMYSFNLNGVQYAGCTRVAGFKNGDVIDLVYEQNEQGNEVYGVRRASTRSIWLYPYMSCGTKAGIIKALKLWFIMSLGGGGVLTIMIVGGVITGAELLGIEEVAFLLGITFPLIAICSLIFLPRLYRFALAANEVFSAFGFENPKWIDFHKTSKEFRKKNNILWNEGSGLELWY